MRESLFNSITLPEITGVDFAKLSSVEIANLLPAFGGKHPVKAILLDKQSGRAYGIASGWDEESLVHNGIPFKAGAIGEEIARQAGDPWMMLGNHVEPVAAAFMRRIGITDAVLYINARNPCWGVPDGTGCFFLLPIFLAEGSTLIVYNKLGDDFLASQPDRKFHFVGAAEAG